MNKKFLSAIMFGAMMTASTGVFVSCEDYGDDIAHLQEQIDQNAAAADSELAAKVAALQSQLSTLEAAQESLKEQLATAKAEAAAAANNALAAAQAAQGGADEAKAAADAANKALSDAVARVAVLESKVASLETTIAELSAASKDLSAKLAEVQTMVTSLKNSTDKNAADVAALSKQVADLNAELSKVSSTLGARIDAIDAQLNEIKATFDKYVTKAELEAKADVLANMDAQLQLQINTNLNYIKEMQAAIASLGEKDKDLAASIEKNYIDVMAEIEELATSQAEALAALEAAVKAGDAKLDEAIKAVKAIAEANAATIKDILANLETKADQTAVDALAKDLAQAMADIADITTDLTAYKADVTEELASINARIDDLYDLAAQIAQTAQANYEDIAKLRELTSEQITDLYDLISQLTTQVTANHLGLVAVNEKLEEELPGIYDQISQLILQATANYNNIAKNGEAIYNLQVTIDDHKLRLGDMEEVVESLVSLANSNYQLIVANQEEIQNLKDELAASIEKITAWQEEFEDKYDALVTSYEEKVKELESKLVDFGLVTSKISKRLTSISLVPSHYLRGVETIMFKTLKYTEKGVNNPGTFYLTNETDNKAVYRMNPTGATVDCVDKDGAKFVANKASNTRATVESPIELTNLAMDVDGDLVVDVKKTLGYEQKSFGTSDDNFYIVALSLPIKSDYLFETEESAVVQSEYVRLSEKTFTPELHAVMPAGDVHLWSNELYRTDVEESVYVRWAYDKELDLTTLVRVCENDANHTSCDFASYGLNLKFDIVGEYLQGSNNTNQQEFAYFVDEAQTTIASCVYDGGKQYTKNAAAINREPIIRVRLMHENRIVDEQYFKIKWEKNTPVDLGVIKQENLSFGCDGYSMIVDTREMNQIFYAHENVNLSSNAFHAIYPDANFTYEGLGSLELIPNTVNGVTSYRIKWNITDAEFKTLYPVLLSDKEISIKGTWTSVDGRGDITFVLKMTVQKPAFGIYGYNESYWNNGVFQMNPIVYGTQYAKSEVTINADLVSYGFNAEKENPAIYLESVITGTDVETAEIIFDLDACKKVATTWGYKSNQVSVTDDGKTLVLNGEIAAKIVDDEDTGDQVLVLQESADYGDAAYGEGSVPTSAAIALVGTDIPVKIVVDPCGDGNIYDNIKNYSVNVTNPFDINSEFEDVFYESTVNGSRVDVSDALTMTDWNGYVVADVLDATISSEEEHKYTQSLYKYYGISSIEWDVENAKTNIKNVNGNLVPTANYTGDIWPDDASFVYDEAANQLVYKNNGATLGKEFVITCPVVVTYKWGECTANVKITVKPGSSAQN